MARRADVDALIAGFERCASTAPLFAEDSSSDERASARRLEDDGDDARDRSASDSDWSDAELRESDGAAFDEKPPSAAQGGGRPWAHAAEGREDAREGRRGRRRRRTARETRTETKRWLDPECSSVICTRMRRWRY